MRLEGRTAIITGASSGIGQATAARFVEEHVNVVLASRSRKKLEALALDLVSFPGRTLVVPTDVTDRLAVEALVRKIAPTPLPVLRLTKLALTRAYEAMGLRQAVHANLDISAVLNAADTPEQREFDRIAAADGLKAALAWRDARYGEALR